MITTTTTTTTTTESNKRVRKTTAFNNKRTHSRSVKNDNDESRDFAKFTKRRDGLVGKAAELSRMFGDGVGVAVLGLSPPGKPFSFGHPSAGDLAGEFLRGGGAAGEIERWVESEFEARKGSVEELEFLRDKYSVLLQKVASRLMWINYSK